MAGAAGSVRGSAVQQFSITLPVGDLSNLHLKEEKIKPDANGAVVKTSANAEKTEEEEKEDRAAQSLLNKLIRSNLVDNTNQVEVLQRDPNSPLYSVKSFEELRLPQNLIAQSQSGTGKTAAFVLAMLSQVEPTNKYPQCLCLSPTYELALQTGKVIEQMGKFYPALKLAYAVRGNKCESSQRSVFRHCIWLLYFVSFDLARIYYVLCSSRDEKFQALCNLYGAITIAQAMIFCHTRKTASWLAAELSKEGHQVALLSGEMMVEQRAAVIERFREGKEKVLVTTNVCARGIDVEQVSVVINFDIPVDKDGNPDNETYLHRIGRTGRFGKRGLAVNMVDSKHSMNILNRIQEHFNKKIERLDTDDLDEIEKIAN
uniref:RNA helicase n=1 Tax=Saimiri boliviensis boliviensis TaxID=39432 RepID=A0A2K6UXU8_SAIBB